MSGSEVFGERGTQAGGTGRPAREVEVPATGGGVGDHTRRPDLARYRAAHTPGSDYRGVRCSGPLGHFHECAVWWLGPRPGPPAISEWVVDHLDHHSEADIG